MREHLPDDMAGADSLVWPVAISVSWWANMHAADREAPQNARATQDDIWAALSELTKQHQQQTGRRVSQKCNWDCGAGYASFASCPAVEEDLEIIRDDNAA